MTDVSQGMVLLEDVVNDYMIRAQKTQHDKARLMTIAYAGIRELTWGVTQSIKTDEFTINPDTKSIDFPPDYVNYSKIGTCINGNLVTLGVNPNMCTENMYDDCGDLTTFVGGNLKGGPVNIIDGNYPDYGGYWFYNWGDRGYHSFGHGGGFNRLGYFKEDREHRRILFSSDIQLESVVMEYLTQGYSPGQQTRVEAFAQDALLAYIAWKDIQFVPELVRIAEIRKQEYSVARATAQIMYRSFTIDEFKQAMRRAYKAVPKN